MRIWISGFVMVLASAAAIAAPHPAAGLPPPAPPVVLAPDPAALTAADRLLDEMKFNDLMNRTIDAMIAGQNEKAMLRMEEVIGEPLPVAVRSRLGTTMEQTTRRMFADNMPNLRKGTALIYASRFSAAEIEQLIVLQRDPLMLKIQREMPQIMVETVALSQAMVGREMPRLIEELKGIVEDHMKTSQD